MADSKFQLTDGFNIEEQQAKILEALKRDIQHVMVETKEGKLKKDSAANLISYCKLLNELEDRQREQASQLSEEELEKLARESKSKLRS